MTRFKIAYRNVFRNRGRSLLSILMIAASVLGIVAFRGFSSHILHLLKDTTINNRYNHIQIASGDTWNLKPGPRKAQLLAAPERLIEKLKTVPGITMASGRLSFFGLISNGETTISAQGIGYDPASEIHFQQSLRMIEGRSLAPETGSETEHEVIIGAGLQKRLSAKVGETLTIISYTLDGVVNAMDLKVAGVFSVGTEDVDNHVFMLPLKVTQTLLDTDAVEIVTVRLASTEDTDKLIPQVNELAKADRVDSSAKSWYEISDQYRQLESFYSFQNFVIELILVSLVLLSIMNSVGMSIYERTGEIGTVRALGETPSTVIAQFMLEAFFLGVFGVVIGWILSVFVSLGVSALDLKMVLPNASLPIPIKIELAPHAFLVAAGIGLFAACASSLIPSIRASKMSIVEALRRNL